MLTYEQREEFAARICNIAGRFYDDTAKYSDEEMSEWLPSIATELEELASQLREVLK